MWNKIKYIWTLLIPFHENIVFIYFSFSHKFNHSSSKANIFFYLSKTAIHFHIIISLKILFTLFLFYKIFDWHFQLYSQFAFVVCCSRFDIKSNVVPIKTYTNIQQVYLTLFSHIMYSFLFSLFFRIFQQKEGLNTHV